MKYVLAALLLITCCASARALWAPATHEQKPIPAEWVPAEIGKSALTEDVILSRERFPFDVVEFLEEFGAPNRYLVSKKRAAGYTDLLVYDLPRYTVGLYVPRPPERRMGAIIVLDENGKDVRLIK